MPKQPIQKNCITEVYKGVKIWRYNTLRLRINSQTKKNLIDLSESTGLSEKKIVCNSSKPCSKCEGTTITVFDKDGNEYQIPKGLISNKHLL